MNNMTVSTTILQFSVFYTVLCDRSGCRASYRVLITKGEAMIPKPLAVIVLVCLAASPIHTRSNGAPVDACADLTQQHTGAAVAACGPPTCPFRIRLTHIDGVMVPAGEEGFYRCGATHTCV